MMPNLKNRCFKIIWTGKHVLFSFKTGIGAKNHTEGTITKTKYERLFVYV